MRIREGTMADQAANNEDVVVAEGVDEEPVESNRRLFKGRTYLLISLFATVYAAFHMAALNGLSISELTGGLVVIPFLPTFPMETWNFRIVHIAGALALGFLMFSGSRFSEGETEDNRLLRLVGIALIVPAVFALGAALSFAIEIANGVMWNGIDERIQFNETWFFGAPLMLAACSAIVLSWFYKRQRDAINVLDLVLAISGIAIAAYLITIYGTLMRNSTGTPFAPIGISIAALAGTLLIMELTRRVAGLALVIISIVFLAYVFTGQYMPGFLNSPAISWQRFFSQIYTDAGILGPTTAVSSTYIILFIIFAAFLQASKVGDYFVNFAFAAAGRARGGPAKVAIFASGLMGMINGTSAGNVVATGSLTIPLMNKVGYQKKVAGAIEASASTGGQIMPPIMGAGAFIMAEITGIPYQEIAIAAIIPAVLYFTSIYFMVDFEAAKMGMRGMRDDELPKVRAMLRRIFLFIPIIILIVALFQGYSVIRAGTLATAAAAVVSWLAPAEMRLTRLLMPGRESSVLGSLGLQALIVAAIIAIAFGALFLVDTVDQTVVTGGGALLVIVLGIWALNRRRRRISQSPSEGDQTDQAQAHQAQAHQAQTHQAQTHQAMNFGSIVKAFEIAGIMSIQIIAVCACAGIIVGVISLTGVGARFSNLLLGLAEASQLLSLVFAMCIAILLGMGMPTTAAYAVAASVVAPGLIELGIAPLTAHFFVFYFAVVSAITPPVALASYAAAGISGANPMETSITSFKIGIAAFVVPFMFFYNAALLMESHTLEIIRAFLTAMLGVFLLSSGVQGWFFGRKAVWILRVALIGTALVLIEGSVLTDIIGIGMAALILFVQRVIKPKEGFSIGVRGAD